MNKENHIGRSNYTGENTKATVSVFAVFIFLLYDFKTTA